MQDARCKMHLLCGEKRQARKPPVGDQAHQTQRLKAHEQIARCVYHVAKKGKLENLLLAIKHSKPNGLSPAPA
jgi:hypothetical protein